MLSPSLALEREEQVNKLRKKSGVCSPSVFFRPRATVLWWHQRQRPPIPVTPADKRGHPGGFELQEGTELGSAAGTRGAAPEPWDAERLLQGWQPWVPQPTARLGHALFCLVYTRVKAEGAHLALAAPAVPAHMEGAVARGHSPLEDEVEPVTDHSHPDEPDAHGLVGVEPDREEDKESVPEVSSKGDEEEQVLGAMEVLLQPVRRLDARVVQEVHAGLHPPAWLRLSRAAPRRRGFIPRRVV